jgi:hypothetical protein
MKPPLSAASVAALMPTVLLSSNATYIMDLYHDQLTTMSTVRLDEIEISDRKFTQTSPLDLMGFVMEAIIASSRGKGVVGAPRWLVTRARERSRTSI